MKKIALMLVAVVLVTSGAFAAGLSVGTALGFPTLQYSLNKDLTGQLGAMYASGGGASSTAILVKVDYKLEKVGEAQPNVGVFYATNGATTATTSFGITYGIGAMVAPNLSLGADIVLVNSVTTGGGASATGILGPGLVGAGIPAAFNTVTLAASYSL
jgi:hypothetical protein